MAPAPDMRIGDAEREATMASLREHFSVGRLTTEELHERLDAALAAKTQADLAAITADLPQLNSYAAPWPPQADSSYSAYSAGGQAPPPPRAQRGIGGRIPRSRVSFALSSMLLLLVVVGMVAFGPFAALPRFVVLILAVFALVRRVFRWVGRR